jgi:hypothetical protein
MKLKRILPAVVGIAQEGIGMLAAILAVLLLLDLVEAETVFSLPPELLPLYVVILGLFSAFSIISGLFLIRGEQE